MKWKLFLCGLFVLGLAITVWLLLIRSPDITEEMASQIRVGMTREQVYAIVKCKPGKYSSVEPGPVIVQRPILDCDICIYRLECWECSSGVLSVVYIEKDLVGGYGYFQAIPRTFSFREWIRKTTGR